MKRKRTRPDRSLRVRGELLESLEPRIFLSSAKLPVMAAIMRAAHAAMLARTPRAHTNLAFSTLGAGNSPYWTALKKGLIVPHSLTPPGNAFNATQIRSAYGMDDIMFGNVPGNGAGQTIAIVTAYHYATALQDLQAFDVAMGLPDPPSFVQVAENGSQNFPPTDPAGPGNSWAMEAALDIQWSHAMAPGANILLVEANSSFYLNMIQGAVNWVRTQPQVSVISMSFGSDEFSAQNTYNSYMTTPAGHQGITFIASTGDDGQPGGYPSYSSNVVAVGGTSLTLSNGEWGSETGWSGSGGGISQFEGKPTYQSSVTQSVTRRTVPDVSMVADPNTGVAVADSWDFPGSPWFRVGGTSLSAPLFAGLIAVANQGRALLGKPTLNGVTDTLPKLYEVPPSDFHDVVSGNNGFAAGPGYDLVTGRGTPIGNLLVRDLAGIRGAVSGTAFVDADRDGVKDAGEGGLSGVTVFIDDNNNGVLDTSSSLTLNSGAINLAIPSNSTVGATSTLTVANAGGLITDINVTVNIAHASDGQLSGKLIGPDGTSITLFNAVGDTGDNFTNTVFDDEATRTITSGLAPFTGSFRPVPGPLSLFDGKSAIGGWKLQILDSVAMTNGQITSWSITIQTGAEISSVTGASGTYALNDLNFGQKNIRATLPSGYEATTPLLRTFDVQGPLTSVNFGYALPTPPPSDFFASAANDVYYLWLDPVGGMVRVAKDDEPGTPIFQAPLASAPQLKFHLAAQGTRLIVDFSTGSPIPAGGVLVDSSDIPTAELEVRGGNGNFAMTDTTFGGITYQDIGSMRILASTVHFSGTLSTLQNVDLGLGTSFYWDS